jgi:hypothetical protein
MKPRGAGAVMADRLSRRKAVESKPKRAPDPRDGLDFFPTPPWATRALLHHVLALTPDHGRALSCWEPCCGEGHMAEPLREVFGRVHASDVYPHGYGAVGSFVGIGGFTFDVAQCPFRPDWIITNPPFELAMDVAERAIADAHTGVALLVRLGWIASRERFDLFRSLQPTIFAPFSERVPMVEFRWDPKASTATDYAWFVWMRPFLPAVAASPRFETLIIPPGCRTRLSRPEDLRFAKCGGVPLLPGG